MPSPSQPRQLHVIHDTSYDYSARVDVAYHLMHLTPRGTDRQQVDSSALTIDPPPTQLGTRVDTFGNRQTYCALFAPHETLHVHAESRVRVAPRGRSIDPEDSPPWEEVRDALRYTALAPLVPAAEFAYPSPFVPWMAELADYARPSFGAGRAWLAAALELMQRVHDDFTYDPAATDVATPLAQAFRQKRGVCQDYAHVLIGSLRALALPAAYVSGYLLTQPPPGQPRLLGADASHAWVSVWCPRQGWVDLDPTNAVLADAGHVSLATGRDFGDVMPLRGVILGGGSHTLDVSVSVIPVDEPASEDAPA
jgi:transglutaminase-like putative cysteine protease